MTDQPGPDASIAADDLALLGVDPALLEPPLRQQLASLRAALDQMSAVDVGWVEPLFVSPIDLAAVDD